MSCNIRIKNDKYEEYEMLRKIKVVIEYVLILCIVICFVCATSYRIDLIILMLHMEGNLMIVW